MKASQERYAHLVARLLRSEQPTAQPRSPNNRRDAIVAAMTLAMAGRARQRRLAWAGAAVLAAAAASLVFVARAMRSEPSALAVEQVSAGSELVRGDTTQPLVDKRALAVGDTIRTSREGEATLVADTGTHVTLSSAANLRIDELGAHLRFSLTSGRLRARVAKLAPSERFLVRMPDGEVEVRGTVFAVTVGEAPAGCRGVTSQSTVEVSEGAVWVLSGGRQILLGPGDSWTAACLDTTAAEATEADVAAAHRPSPEKPTKAKEAPIVSSKSSRAGVSRAAALPREEGPADGKVISSLAEQNDMFAAAMAAERRGEHELALRQLDDLIRRFPGGPLRESAQAEQARILSAQSTR